MLFTKVRFSRKLFLSPSVSIQITCHWVHTSSLRNFIPPFHQNSQFTLYTPERDVTTHSRLRRQRQRPILPFNFLFYRLFMALRFLHGRKAHKKYFLVGKTRRRLWCWMLNVYIHPFASFHAKRAKVCSKTNRRMAFRLFSLLPWKTEKTPMKHRLVHPKNASIPNCFLLFRIKASVLLRHPSVHIKSRKQGNSHEHFLFSSLERWEFFRPGYSPFSRTLWGIHLFAFSNLHPLHLRKYDSFILFFSFQIWEASGVKPGRE